jgi:hypothetical protein
MNGLANTVNEPQDKNKSEDWLLSLTILLLVRDGVRSLEGSHNHSLKVPTAVVEDSLGRPGA